MPSVSRSFYSDQPNGQLQALGIAVDYYEEDAGHDWSFWDREIRRFLRAVLGPPPAG